MYVSIDMGATNTRVASTNDLDNIHKIERFKTRKNFEEQKILLQKAVSAVAQDGNIENIVVGVPGRLNYENNSFANLPNFPYLNNKKFSDLIDSPNVVFTNDALLGGLAEACLGAGSSYSTVAYITLGTGVGGVRIQKSDNGTCSYFLAEPGHHIITNSDRYSNTTGLNSTLELHVSGKSFQEIYGQTPEECSDEKIWEDYSKFLTVGIINILAFWSPDILIFGGSVSNKFNTFMPFVVKEFSKQRFFDPVDMKQAQLGDDAGVFGGFEFIKNLIK